MFAGAHPDYEGVPPTKAGVLMANATLSVTVRVGRWPPTREGLRQIRRVWVSGGLLQGSIRRPWLFPKAVWLSLKLAAFKVVR